MRLFLTALLLITATMYACSSSSDDRVRELEGTIEALTRPTSQTTASPRAQATQATSNDNLNFTYRHNHFDLTLRRALRTDDGRLVLTYSVTARDTDVEGGQLKVGTTVITDVGAEYEFYGKGPEVVHAGGNGDYCVESNNALPAGSVVSQMSLSWATVPGNSPDQPIRFTIPPIDVGRLPLLRTDSDVPSACR